jgi:branched-chain amino acid transport system permease protein
MVIIGGAGSLWGAMLGAAIVRYLDYYLGQLSTQSWVANLPAWLHNTIGQPLLIFGVIYLLLVYFFPQGIAGLTQRWAIFRSAVPQPGLGEVEARGGATAADEPSSAESPPLETLPRS